MKQNNKKFNNAMHKFVGVLDKYVRLNGLYNLEAAMLTSDCVRERCKINRKSIKQDTISRSKQDLFREVKIYFVLLHIFSPFSIFE